MIFYSIIIPHRDSIGTLLDLLESIPISDSIEVLVVDNSEYPLKKEDVHSSRDFKLLYSNKKFFAGGARNVGLQKARGKWIIFADADDYFTSQAFCCFERFQQSESDLIFFKSQSYFDSIVPIVRRGEKYSRYVTNYLTNLTTDSLLHLRLDYSVVWGIMIRRDYIVNNQFSFEGLADGDDSFFALKITLNTQKIEAVDEYVYVVTESSHSLSKRREYPYVSARYKATLQANKYLREHDLSQYQRSIMYNFLYCCRYGLRPAFRAVRLMWQYRQNPFIGWRNWWGTVKRLTSH